MNTVSKKNHQVGAKPYKPAPAKGGVDPQFSQYSDIGKLKGDTKQKSHQPTCGYHRAD